MISVHTLVKSLSRKDYTPRDLIEIINSTAANEHEFRIAQVPGLADHEFVAELFRLCKAEGYSAYRVYGSASLSFTAPAPYTNQVFQIAKSGPKDRYASIIRTGKAA